MSFAAGGGMRAMRSFRKDASVTKQRLRKGTIRRVLGFARPYRGLLIMFLVMVLVDAASGALTPLLVKGLIDDGVGGHNTSLVAGLAVAIGALALLGAALSLGERWVSARVGEGLIFDLRTAVFDHVQRMPLAFFARTRTGALIQRLNGDVLGAQEAFTSTLQNVFANGLTIIFVLAAMFSMSWQLTLIALVLLPLFVIPARWVGRRLAEITRRGYELNAEAAQTMNERFNVAGAHLSKIFGQPERESAMFAAQADQIRSVGVRQAMYGGVFRVGLTLIAAVAVAIVYGAGGVLAVHGELTVGVVVALATYLSRLYAPLTAMSNVQVDVMTALVSFERVLEVLDLPPNVVDAPQATSLTPAIRARGADLAFDHVGFRYPSAAEVSLASLESVAAETADPAGDTLIDVSFTIPAGAMVALVGPSGAGKTTISQLATRMYDPSRGSVRIAGCDLRDVTQASLREAVGVVTQEAHLYHDTIAGNLRFAKPDASDAQIMAALERAHIRDLVDRLPAGIDTLVGDRGYRLSGGERQRLALARVFLKAPAVVILDEATAHLDSESEAAVQAALADALRGRTSLVIAHRLSTVRDADLIVVLDEGAVVEQGTHEQLLARNGLYAELYRTQFQQTAGHAA